MFAVAGRKTRASPRGEVRRREILDAATRLFSERGFENATYSELAADVGLSQAGLLHYFPSKRDLLLGVLQRRDERIHADADRRAQMNFLDAFVDVLRVNEANPVLVQLFGLLSAESIREDHPAHEYFTTHYEQAVRHATEGLRDIVDEDALPDGATVETVARWLIGAADGLRLQWLLDPSAPPRSDVVELLIASLRPYFKDA